MAHPLINRRPEPAAVEPEAHPMDPYAVSLNAGLSEMIRLLRDLKRDDRAMIAQLCVTDAEPAQLRRPNFPVPGAERLIVRRSGAGGTFTLAANTPALVAAPNEARLGGQIVNTGGQGVFLYLTATLLEGGSGTPLSAGTPVMWLGPNGGAWDFLLGNVLWCGSVLAFATAAASVAVAEV